MRLIEGKHYARVAKGSYGHLEHGTYTCLKCNKIFPLRYYPRQQRATTNRGWTWFFNMAWYNFEKHARRCWKEEA